MVAGEASGDVLAGLLLDGLRARWPALVAEGIGGPKMAEQGFEAWWPHDKLAVRGYVEVLGHFREILGIRNQLTERLMKDKPDAFIGVDAPDFNLDLEVKLRAAGVKTVHFVSPSIWAWRGKRVEKIKKAADLVLCIFPFEPEIYEKHGVNAVYVGHPIASEIPVEPPRAEARAALKVGDDETLIAVLPGSRRSEIQYVAPRLFGAAREIAKARPGTRFVVPVVTGLRHVIEPIRRAVRARGGDRAARRPRPPGARRLRRRPRRQRHRHARGGALQAAAGRRLRDARHLLADGQAHALPALDLACPTSCCATSPCPSCCSATPARKRSPPRPSSGSTIRPPARPCGCASRRCTASCAATPPGSPPMRSRPS